MKKIYGIGTGPGAPELLTLKAVEIMKKSHVVFAPNNKGKNMALDTAKEYIEGKKIVLIDFPMGSVTREDYIRAAEIIERETPDNGIGAFLTIGDPMIYSTFIYIMDELEERFKDLSIEIVPGIPSFVGAAAASKTPLTVKSDNFILCDEFQEDLLDKTNSLVILKTLSRKKEIIEKLRKKKFNYKYIRKVSLEEEYITDKDEEILGDKNYISLILARKDEERQE